LSLLRKRAAEYRVGWPGHLPRNAFRGRCPGHTARTNELTVWSPWGDDFTPKGPPGLQHGWPRRHGMFKIPLADFVRVFSTLDIERG
jgi:hypothetical protein